jgi:hypothetical protein
MLPVYDSTELILNGHFTLDQLREVVAFWEEYPRVVPPETTTDLQTTRPCDNATTLVCMLLGDRADKKRAKVAISFGSFLCSIVPASTCTAVKSLI